MRVRAIASSVGVLLLLLACGSAEPEAPASAPGAARADAGTVGEAPDALALPAPGEVEVRVGPQGTVAVANQAPRRKVLEAIARETGLVVLSFIGGRDPGGRVTLRSEGESIEVLLARALGGVAYSIEPIEPGDRISLAVGSRAGGGTPGQKQQEAAATPRPPPARAERSREERVPLPDEEAFEQLTSRDPAERLEGVEWMDVTSSAGYEAVVERLENDPDPEVRAAAADSLGDADVGAVGPLVKALEDTDRRVVMAALDSLELLGDTSTLPKLAPALRHSDREVRERADEVADFLE
jgi:hypothetical protein